MNAESIFDQLDREYEERRCGMLASVDIVAGLGMLVSAVVTAIQSATPDLIRVMVIIPCSILAVALLNRAAGYYQRRIDAKKS